MGRGAPEHGPRTLAASPGGLLVDVLSLVLARRRADPPGLGLWAGCRAPMQLCPLARVSSTSVIFVIKSGLLPFILAQLSRAGQLRVAGAPLPPPPCEPGILPSWTWGLCVERQLSGH